MRTLRYNAVSGLVPDINNNMKLKSEITVIKRINIIALLYLCTGFETGFKVLFATPIILSAMNRNSVRIG